MANPYNYHLPVQDDAMFFGRVRLQRRLSDGLTQPRPISAAVFGGRRSGKTSLLRKLERDMRQGTISANRRRLVPWYYDPQAGYPITCSDDFFLLILEDLRQTLCPQEVSLRILEDTYGSALRLGPSRAFEESFRLLNGQVQERIRAVLLIDEAEALLVAPWGGDLRPNLRNLLSNSGIANDLALLMCGSTAFHTQVTEKDSPLENILTRYSLSNLTHEETLALSHEPQSGELSERAAEEIWVQTGGHPCLAQFILHELWYDRETATPEDVQDVASSFSEMLDHFERWSAALTPLALAAYTWLIDRTFPTSYRNVRRAFAHEDGGDLQRALDSLAYHGLIQLTGRGRRTRYALAGQMFREWYLTDRPAHTGEVPNGDQETPSSSAQYQVHIEHAAHVAVGERAQVIQQPEAGTPPSLEPVPHHSYETFDLEIEPRAPGRYEIQVLSAPTGSARSPEMAFDPRALEFMAMLERVQAGDVNAALLTEVGQRLYRFLFPGSILAAYVSSQEAARRHDRGLCIQLRLREPELAALPWELLCDPQDQHFVALSGRTPLLRTVPGVLESQLPPVSLPWRLLLVTAAPQDMPALDIEREKRAILNAIAPLIESNQVAIEMLDHATPNALLAALRSGCHGLHFIGHGEYGLDTEESALILEREDGTSARLDINTLRHLLPEAYAQAGDRLRLVFLNACATAQVGRRPGTRGLAQTLVQAGIPTSIGMGRPIADQSARAFSEGFYGALAEQGWPFHAAVAEGRRRAMLESGIHSGDWAVPVLFIRH